MADVGRGFDLLMGAACGKRGRCVKWALWDHFKMRLVVDTVDVEMAVEG